MVVFLLISTFGTIIYYLTAPVFAADDTSSSDIETETDESAPADETVIDTSGDEKLIRVGLMYGNDVTVGFETDAPNGFIINRVNRTADLSSEPLWEIDLTKVSCTVDANLSKTAMTYSKTADTAKAVIGGWHIKVGDTFSRDDVVACIKQITPYLDELGIYAIPSYIGGTYSVRAGHFTDEASAVSNAQKLQELMPDFSIGVAAPTKTAVSLVDPVSDKILFEYDDNDTTALGLAARQSPDGETAYLVTPAKKLYAGTFMFRRYITDSVDGVSLTDIIKLGDYVKGVISYEISPSWPLEAQKAFAIAVRSFTLAKVRHESSYQVDVCNKQHCQVYGGMTRVNDAVNQAVDETAGLVMAHNGKIIEAYYSAVTGGVTVSSYDEWGYQRIPYLVAVKTPWEIYTNHSKGSWTTEVSPAELCTYLRDTKGYTSLRSEIASITIDQLAENSTYVRNITFTDTYGTKVSIKTCEKVRLALSKYVNSANFVVGKGEVEAEQTTFTSHPIDSLAVRTSSATHSLADVENASVITAFGKSQTTISDSYYISAYGKNKVGETSALTETVTVYAKDPDNFIFVGKGWGHGVGLSQIGVRDLANIGYTAEEILPKYFTDTVICDLRTLS